MSDESKFQKVSDFCSSSFGPLMAISGHIGWMRFTSALPPKADITGEKLDRSLKADFWCLLCPLKRTQMGMALDVRS